MSEAGLRGRGHDVTGLLLLVVAAISLLALFGDKVAARATAVENQVPVLMASPVLESPEDLQMFLSESPLLLSTILLVISIIGLFIFFHQPQGL